MVECQISPMHDQPKKFSHNVAQKEIKKMKNKLGRKDVF